MSYLYVKWNSSSKNLLDWKRRFVQGCDVTYCKKDRIVVLSWCVALRIPLFSLWPLLLSRPSTRTRGRKPVFVVASNLQMS